jgi:hypothetical protein
MLPSLKNPLIRPVSVSLTFVADTEGHRTLLTMHFVVEVPVFVEQTENSSVLKITRLNAYLYNL